MPKLFVKGIRVVEAHTPIIVVDLERKEKGAGWTWVPRYSELSTIIQGLMSMHGREEIMREICYETEDGLGEKDSNL